MNNHDRRWTSSSAKNSEGGVSHGFRSFRRRGEAGEKQRIAELIAAAHADDTGKVKQFLSKGVDINASEPESGDTALLAAIDKGHWAAAEYLLTQKPDLTREEKDGNSLLYLNVSRGDSAVAMVRRLLDAGSPVELGPQTRGFVRRRFP